MSRITSQFDRLRLQKRKALIAFFTAGFPTMRATERLFMELVRVGVDIVELGIPFSDPMADGPVIQRASEVSLANGTTIRKIIGLIRRIRKKSDTPILLMGYYNPILAYGLKKFAKDASRAGVDGLLVVDLPPEESAPLDKELKAVGIDLIYLLAPTSGPDRIRLVSKRARGFVYYVSMTGITGARLKGLSTVRKKIFEIRRMTRLPVAVGFGIRTVSQARQLAFVSDGVVVGSEIVRRLGEKGGIKSASSFVSSIRGSLA